jgi:CIC family chloride channel protein
VARALATWRRLLAVRGTAAERRMLFALTVVIGGVSGLAAVGFHMAVDRVTRLTINRAMAAPGRSWMWWTMGVPAAGCLIAGVLLQYLVPNARGSGVTQAKVAYALRSGGLRLRDSIGKFLLSSLQIGTGSSLGVEGPTVQICSGIASALGRLLGISAENVRRMLPVGAAAGIAAAFNAPMAAVTFTVEEIVGDLDQTLLSGVIVAAALAAVVERSLLGSNPVFDVPQGFGLQHPSSLALYAVLGLIAGGLAIAFSESLLRLRMWFRRQRALPGWIQPVVGGLVTGLLATAALGLLRAGGITGGGYATLHDALWAQLPVKVLVCLCVMKLASTVFSYASGGAGGIFAPSLFVGGMAGGAVGALDMAVFGHSISSMGAFALVGMGAVFAGVIRAPITSVLIIIEMTNGYSLILPLMIANMIAYAVARGFRSDSIYEALLQQDGVDIHPAKPAPGAGRTLLVADVPLSRRGDCCFSRGVDAAELLGNLDRSQQVFPVTDGDRLVGLVTVDDLSLLAAESELLNGLVKATDLMRSPIALRPQDDLRVALQTMVSTGLRELPVIDEQGRILGLLDEAAIAHAYVGAQSRSWAAAGEQ